MWQIPMTYEHHFLRGLTIFKYSYAVFITVTVATKSLFASKTFKCVCIEIATHNVEGGTSMTPVA